MHKYIRSVLIALVVAGVATSSVASAAEVTQVSKPTRRIAAAAKSVAAIEANDMIPGIVAPASPIIDSLDELSDIEDIYKIHLTAGDKLILNMTGPADPADFDLFLFDPTATDTAWDLPVDVSANAGSTEAIAYTALVTGDYYIDVLALAGTGTYSLAHTITAPEADDDIPGVAAPASPITGAVSDVDDDDVYKIYLAAGSKLTLNMTGPAEPADYDLYLFGPAATSILSDYVAASFDTSCTESITYTAVTSGYHYVDVQWCAGAGTYSVAYTVTLPVTSVTNAKFSNPIAYKLKSLLSTQFQCTVNTTGATARLDILNGTGGVVKTVYSGALANGTNILPRWNGLDKYGRRLPSSSYKWRLVVSKPGSAAVTTYGNITISKIYFLLSGNSSTATQNFSRYMVPGNANLYFAMNTAEPTGDVFSLAVKEPSGVSTGAFAWNLAAPGTVNRTGYLRSTTAVKQFGMHNFAIRSNHSTAYSVIVIQ